jgi:hypothetical protein
MAQVSLLSAATATNSAPSGATAGVALPYTTDYATVLLYSTAGSGTMTVTCKLWGYNTQLAKWFPLGTHATAASKGLLNEANAIAETSADGIAHAEQVQGLRAFQRVYLEVTAIGGTNTAVSAVLDCVRCDGATS